MKMTVDLWACRELDCIHRWVYRDRSVDLHIKPRYAPTHLVRSGWYNNDAPAGFKLWT